MPRSTPGSFYRELSRLKTRRKAWGSATPQPKPKNKHTANPHNPIISLPWHVANCGQKDANEEMLTNALCCVATEGVRPTCDHRKGHHGHDFRTFLSLFAAALACLLPPPVFPEYEASRTPPLPLCLSLLLLLLPLSRFLPLSLLLSLYRLLRRETKHVSRPSREGGGGIRGMSETSRFAAGHNNNDPRQQSRRHGRQLTPQTASPIISWIQCRERRRCSQHVRVYASTL